MCVLNHQVLWTKLKDHQNFCREMFNQKTISRILLKSFRFLQNIHLATVSPDKQMRNPLRPRDRREICKFEFYLEKYIVFITSLFQLHKYIYYIQARPSLHQFPKKWQRWDPPDRWKRGRYICHCSATRISSCTTRTAGIFCKFQLR